MNNPDINKAAKYFESIFTVANVGIVIVDQDCIILRVNPAFTKILGYEENEIVGKPFSILTSKDEFKQESISYSPLNRFYAVEKSSMEDRFYDKTGQDVPIRFRSVIIKDEQRQVAEAVGIIEQIVELTRTGELGSNLAEKMWEAQQNFENILENSADAVLICDNSGNITMANNTFLQMLNYPQEEVVGKFIVNFTAIAEGTYATTSGEGIIIDEEWVKNTGSKSAELYEKGYIENWETYFVRKDKVHIPVEATLSMLKDEEGEKRGSIVILRDITERRKSEIENKKSRKYLENIFKTTADGILVTDDEGTITMANESLENILGYSKGELLGKHTKVLMSEGKKHLEIAEKQLTILFEKGVVASFECEYLKKDGRLIKVEVNSALLKDDKDNVTGAVSSIRDITERRKAEKEIKETRDFLENIFRTTPDGIIVTDNQGCIMSVNKAIEQMLGFREDELVGQHTAELGTQNEECIKVGEAALTQLLEKGYVKNWETLWYRKDKTLCPVEINITSLKDQKGTISGSVGVIRDITERKIAEEALKKSELEHHDLVEFANIGIIKSDNFKITHVNKKAEEIYYYTKEELIGKSPSILTPEKYQKNHREVAKKHLSMAKTSKMVFEEEGVRKDGTLFPVEISFTLHPTYENTVVAFVRDVTERKEIERKLLQSEKLKSLGELSGGVAHDFNNVLAAILGRAQLLKMIFEPPPGKEERRKSVLELKKGLEVIERASLDGAETVRRIQEFARRRVNDQDFTQVDISELLGNALEFTRVRWKNDAESKGIKIRIKKELSPLSPILGSPSELREVFTNLINNAIDAMPQGGKIKVESYMDNSIAVIRISDTGTGIPKDIKDRIFDPFFTTKGVQSTGLGLSVSYGIVNRHQGTITVDSIEGKGTIFTIKFPITKKTVKGKVKEEKVIPIKKKQKEARILVIEDEEDVRQLLKDILTDAGHEVEVASDGNKGIKMFEEKEFDLVFTDLGMSVMSGWEIAKKIKSFRGEVPVALITGWNVELESSVMKDRGINLVIHKPFKIEQVLNLVQEGMILRDQLKAV